MEHRTPELVGSERGVVFPICVCVCVKAKCDRVHVYGSSNYHRSADTSKS